MNKGSKMKTKVDTRKLIGTIIGSIAFICCIIFFTYAWYTWRSNNNNVNIGIVDDTGLEIEIENDGNVTVNNIGPILNMTDGVVSGFNVDNPTDNDVEITIKFNLADIDEELLSDTLEYTIVKSEVSPRTEEYNKDTLVYDYDNPVISGNFSDFNVGTNILGTTIVPTNNFIFYKVIFYINGEIENNTNMMGKGLTGTIMIEDLQSDGCMLSVASATYKDVAVGFYCNESDGVSSYTISMTSDDVTKSCTEDYPITNIPSSIYETCTFESFDLSTIELSLVNEEDEIKRYTMDDTELETGYNIIYEALNEKYETVEDEDTLLNELYPIGSLYVSTTSTNPSTLFGGTWEAYAEGRTLVGVGSNETDNYTAAEQTGGSETVSLTTYNLPSHTHSGTATGSVSSTFTGTSATTSTDSYNHSHIFSNIGNCGSSYGLTYGYTGFGEMIYVTGDSWTPTSSAGAHTHTYTAAGAISNSTSFDKVNTNSRGSGTAFNILNPYIVTYIWKRTG